MKYFRYILLLPLLLSVTSSFAKKHKADTTNYTNMRLYSIFIEPLALIDVYNSPSIRLGTEYSLSRHYSIVPTLGVYHNGGMIKLEAKKYFSFNHKHHHYISLEYFYKATEYHVKDSIQAPMPYNRKYVVDKYANALAFKTGIVTFSRHHFVTDAYLGLGIRYHDVILNGITPYEANNRYRHSQSFIDRNTNSAGKNIVPDITLGICLGFRYKTKRTY